MIVRKIERRELFNELTGTIYPVITYSVSAYCTNCCCRFYFYNHIFLDVHLMLCTGKIRCDMTFAEWYNEES